MTIQTAEGFVPEWTIGDRLRKARNSTGLTTRQFADRLGVSQATVTNAENGHHRVRRITINAWSMATGVSKRWLETGEATMSGPPEPTSELPDDSRNTHQYLAELAPIVVDLFGSQPGVETPAGDQDNRGAAAA